MNYQRQPTEAQRIFVEFFADRITRYLDQWGRQAGASTARKMLAERILKDDK